MKEIAFSRRAVLLMTVAALVLIGAGFLAGKMIGTPWDPFSLENKALLAALAGFVPGVGLGIVAQFGNACPQCKKPMKYVLEDGGRVGINLPFLDYFVRRCRHCGHERD